jgi:hypothetical protein
MSEFVRVTDGWGIEWVRRGVIDGDTYHDGEVWANREQLEARRAKQGVGPDAPATEKSA